MQNGFVKLHRSLLEWEWWDDIPVFRLFIYLIMKANHAPKKWKGELIERGQTITSIQSLAKGTGLSIKQVRTALAKLESTGEVASKRTNKFSLITLVKYGVYQLNGADKGKQEGKPEANEGQTKGKQRATNKNEKKNKNDKNDKKVKDLPFENFENEWNRYIDFRRTKHKFTFLDERSEQSALTKLKNLSSNNRSVAIKIIDQSIDMGWKGLFKLNHELNGEAETPGKLKGFKLNLK